MMKIASRLTMAAAAATMAVAPIAVQANTRAGDSGASYSTSAAQPGLGRAANGESVGGGASVLLAILASALIIGGIVMSSDSDDNGQSPGT